MTDKLTQQLIPFGESPSETLPESHAEAVMYQPTKEAREAVERLEDWLTNPRTGRMTEEAEEIVATIKNALLKGRNSYLHKAEDLLEILALRNGPQFGDDIAREANIGEIFHETLDDLLDCLHERFTKLER